MTEAKTEILNLIKFNFEMNLSSVFVLLCLVLGTKRLRPKTDLNKV